MVARVLSYSIHSMQIIRPTKKKLSLFNKSVNKISAVKSRGNEIDNQSVKNEKNVHSLYIQFAFCLLQLVLHTHTTRSSKSYLYRLIKQIVWFIVIKHLIIVFCISGKKKQRIYKKRRLWPLDYTITFKAEVLKDFNSMHISFFFY